jgi:hypothetical protein
MMAGKYDPNLSGRGDYHQEIGQVGREDLSLVIRKLEHRVHLSFNNSQRHFPFRWRRRGIGLIVDKFREYIHSYSEKSIVNITSSKPHNDKVFIILSTAIANIVKPYNDPRAIDLANRCVLACEGTMRSR